MKTSCYTIIKLLQDHLGRPGNLLPWELLPIRDDAVRTEPQVCCCPLVLVCRSPGLCFAEQGEEQGAAWPESGRVSEGRGLGWQEMKVLRKGWTEWDGKEILGESRDLHGTEMSAGMDSRCEKCRDLSFLQLISHVSPPWSQQVNGENSAVQCHPPPVAGAEEQSLVQVPVVVRSCGASWFQTTEPLW